MQPSGTVLTSPPFACFDGVLHRHRRAAAPQRAAAAIVSAITLWLTKGRAASWTATSLPWAAATPLRALSARVEPPFTSRTGFCSGQRPAGHSHRTRRSRSPARPPPDTRQRPGRSAPGRSHRPDRSSVYQIPSGWKNQPPPGTAVTRHSNFLHLPHFIPALRRTAQSVLLFIEYYSVSTHKLQLPAPIKMPPCSTFGAVRGHKFFMKFLRYARMGSMAAARASF